MPTMSNLKKAGGAGAEKRDSQKSNKVEKGEDSEGPCRPSRGLWLLL